MSSGRRRVREPAGKPPRGYPPTRHPRNRPMPRRRGHKDDDDDDDDVDDASRGQPDSGKSSQSGSERDTSSNRYNADEWENQQARRPITMIDWRGELCRFLNVDPHEKDDTILDRLYEAHETLREAESYKMSAMQQIGPPRCEVIYDINCANGGIDNGLYLQPPRLVEHGPCNAHLRAETPISHMELHLERNKDVAFLVYRRYSCCDRSQQSPKSRIMDPEYLFTGEDIETVSEDLKDALAELAQVALSDIPNPLFGDGEYSEISYPYLWWYHRRQEIDVVTSQMENSSFRQLIGVLKDYMHERLQHDWESVDSMLSRERISAKYIEYLFVPNSVLICAGQTLPQTTGATSKDWMTVENASPLRFSASILVARWTFDGTFQKVTEEEPINGLPVQTRDEEFAINRLPLYPMKFASKGLIAALRRRGEMFWKCRRRNLVSYADFSTDGIQSSNSRYMVDVVTYQQMHPDAKVQYGTETLDPDDMINDDFAKKKDNDEFTLCLPTSLFGFNMLKKEWVNLEVAYMADVEWNNRAFEDLVIDPNTKELVKAVVTTQLSTEESTDLIRGKGNGLFILLHGGPGTGKTLTAESVAEIAKKPLYRVTCGDIGTKAEEVEKYLELVLTLGKQWGCVVLLDEADVFLEQRQISNLERNALVSVFLRVLEYYDGILILTSNRVGTFDEAFKSRIQLNVRYQNLNEGQRLLIWGNFIKRLEEIEENRYTTALPDETNSSVGGGGVPTPSDTTQSTGSGGAHLTRRGTATTAAEAIQMAFRPRAPLSYGLNAQEIKEKLPSLASTALNGREIRNAISTARQLSMYRKQPLGYEHLKAVIDESRKFEEYLNELHDGFTADEMRRDDGAR